MRPNGFEKMLCVIPKEGFVRDVDEHSVLSGRVVLRGVHDELLNFPIELSTTDR